MAAKHIRSRKRRAIPTEQLCIGNLQVGLEKAQHIMSMIYDPAEPGKCKKKEELTAKFTVLYVLHDLSEMVKSNEGGMECG